MMRSKNGKARAEALAVKDEVILEFFRINNWVRKKN